MNLLIDTHLLIWTAWRDPRLPRRAAAMIDDPANAPWFSTATLWEVAIKRARGRADFIVDAAQMRAGLLANGYSELPVEGRHALEVARLPPLHGDPFDRMLVAQARVEGMVLLTADAALAAYDPTIRLV